MEHHLAWPSEQSQREFASPSTTPWAGTGRTRSAKSRKLFKRYGFTEREPTENVGGERRTEAEAYQRRIDWGDPDQRRRYLMLIDDVLENYPDVDGKPAPETKKVRRALKLAGIDDTAPASAPGRPADDDLSPVEEVRVFVSHLATRKAEAHELAEVLRAVGLACFVAHDDPSIACVAIRDRRALRSCDLLVAYVSPKFSDSHWTDQEVGWALGRDLVVIRSALTERCRRASLAPIKPCDVTTGRPPVHSDATSSTLLSDAVLTNNDQLRAKSGVGWRGRSRACFAASAHSRARVPGVWLPRADP